MLKNTEKYEEKSKSHFTYDEYRKKMKKRPNRDITIFISVFIVGVLILLGFAKVLSPNVDVGITDNENYPSYSEEDNTKQASIDERLKKLQMEDNGEMFSPELDEKVVIPNGKKRISQKETLSEDETKEVKSEDKAVVNVPAETKITKETHEKEVKNSHEAKQTTAQTTTTPTQITSAKVVIGSYANEKQAEVAKSILQDSGIGVTPIIKNIGGTYTLQVGAYSSREKAQQATNSLIKSNFPARVVVE